MTAQQPAPAADATAAIRTCDALLADAHEAGESFLLIANGVLESVLALARLAAGVQTELGAWITTVHATEAAEAAYEAHRETLPTLDDHNPRDGCHGHVSRVNDLHALEDVALTALRARVAAARDGGGEQ